MVYERRIPLQHDSCGNGNAWHIFLLSVDLGRLWMVMVGFSHIYFNLSQSITFVAIQMRSVSKEAAARIS